ncbi:hypothetical protein Hanom_Chr04g00365921 [Helianthus anomalus]
MEVGTRDRKSESRMEGLMRERDKLGFKVGDTVRSNRDLLSSWSMECPMRERWVLRHDSYSLFPFNIIQGPSGLRLSKPTGVSH